MYSLWEKQSFFAPADILIAGSGFVGLWSAFYLKQKYPKLSIAILDRGSVPVGASTRNAGFACIGSATELLQDASMMGVDRMLQLAELRYKGLRRIRKVFSKKEIDYESCGGYELIASGDEARYKDLPAQVKWLNRELAAILPVRKNFHFKDDAIQRFGVAGMNKMIFTPLEGALHPGKLCLALLQRVQALGVRVLPGTDIRGFEQSTDGILAQLNDGLEMRGSKLLVCTNAFARQLLPSVEVVPARGQVLVTAPIPSLKIRGTFHFDEGYYYFRNLGNRLLLGGARNSFIQQETTTTMETSEEVQQTLERFLQNHLLPGVSYEITDRWSGIMGMGPEKFPVVKKIGLNTYCAVGMSGMGVALAPVIGQQVAEML